MAVSGQVNMKMGRELDGLFLAVSLGFVVRVELVAAEGAMRAEDALLGWAVTGGGGAVDEAAASRGAGAMNEEVEATGCGAGWEGDDVDTGTGVGDGIESGEDGATVVDPTEKGDGV